MLNEQKIKKMRKLAAYESGKGREDLSISNYYRSDYIGLAMIKNFFITTIAYVLLLAVYFGYKSEYMMDNLHKIDLFSLGIKIINISNAVMRLSSFRSVSRLSFLLCHIFFSAVPALCNTPPRLSERFCI